MDYEDLARRLKDGEEQAFRDFARCFGYRFRAKFLDLGLEPFQAEDLAVDCVTDIASMVHRYTKKENAGFSAWVMTIATRAGLDWLRQQKLRREQLPDNFGELFWDDTPDECSALEPQDGPRINSALALVITCVRDAMNRLADEDRLIIELHVMEQTLSFKEIARMLDLSEVNARVRHHRALERLEKILRADPRFRIPATSGK